MRLAIKFKTGSIRGYNEVKNIQVKDELLSFFTWENKKCVYSMGDIDSLSISTIG